MKIVILYASLLSLLYLALTFRTILLRRKLRAALGDAGDKSLQRAIRAHANFAEYVPLALVLLVLVEGSGASGLMVHSLGAALLLGRLLHALGISRVREPLPLRMVGMVLTTTCLLVSGAYLLVAFLRGVGT
ncbi:MAG: MAPEG family protein [Ahniella sp.]|nr:MAPEG family protein [Ahniella sp.]